MIRDFVNTYAEDGQACNLVLVVIYRQTLNGALQRRKLHNICMDPDTRSTDVYYVQDVFDRHLNREGLWLRRFDTLYIVGDHGPHFVGKETFYNESRFLNKYGVKVHVMFFCSYHAYSEADGAGVGPKQLMKAALAANQGPKNARQFAKMINKDGQGSTERFAAYPFPVINKSKSLFGNVKFLEKRQDGHSLGKLCEVTYLPGVEGAMLARHVPGEGPWVFIDLIVRAANEKICGWCTSHQLEAVRHQGQPCPLMQRASTVEDVADIGREPDPMRLDRYL